MATQPTKPGFISDVAVTGGDMLQGGVRTGLKTFGYTLLGGLALAALGGVGVVAAAGIGLMTGFGFVLGGASLLAGVIGLGLAGSSVSLGGIGFGIGALLGPSKARDRRVSVGQEVAGPTQQDLQSQIAQQRDYNQQLKGTYNGLASSANAALAAPAAAAPFASPEAPVTQPEAYNPQLKSAYNQLAADVASNGQAIQAPVSYAQAPAEHKQHSHVARVQQRAQSQALAGDPTMSM